MQLIDTHCHLYGTEFQEDIDAVIARAEAEGVQQFYLPGIDSQSIDAMLHLETKFPGKCIAMMGLHPCYVKENYLEELAIVRQWLERRSFAAIGEIGLDFHWDRNYDEQQYEAFRTQVQWAKTFQLPIVIHSRKSTMECLRIIQEEQDGTLKGIFHCFSGDTHSAEKILELGFSLGIGGVLTYKNAGLAEVLKSVPLSAIVLETDAPYLTPVPFRGKRNESSYLKYVLEKLAAIKEMPVADVAAITTVNAQKIFK